ncbi:hypothetical protein [uncultured Allomuricauda sp.]|uniref:hypothetical protein n=1 Tax=Flagellimonas sp. W118 TaxID=3410791 RepID=UPI002615A3A4|nr:hypothetical protein [uncultured Allomuricauda sp.]
MLNFFKAALTPLVSLAVISVSYGQDQAQISYYNSFDNNVGIENTGLYQGVIYTDKYRTINENTQFFQTREFQDGSVCYDGQCYYDLELRYDVYEDEVLLRLANNVGGGTLRLIKDYVESFEIDGHNFVKILPADAPLLGTYGFYEVALESASFTLYIKYAKKNFDRKDRKSIYYEFLDGPSENVLYYNGDFTIIRSKKDIVSLFPDLKREIDKFYNVARGLRKSNPDGFRISLMKRIEILLSQKANQSEK